jgi:RNA polymerase sigma-70 factor (ECF subfamily)
MDDPDKQLVERALRGEAAAFVALLDRHRGPLLAMIRRLVDDEHLRQDILQETLLSAWEDLPRLRDPARVRPWLIAVARNRCRDLLKSAGRREQASSHEQMEVHLARLGRVVHDPMDRTDAADLVERISDVQRPAARMFYIDGLSVRQIAQRMCLSEGTVKSRLFHARRSLRRLIESDEDQE